MNKYLLTIIGNIDSEKCPDIVLSLGDVVDSKHVKFIHNPNAFMFCFASRVERDNLFCYITDVLYGVSDTFILSNITEDPTVAVPKSIGGFIFDLENGEQVGFEYRDLSNNDFDYEEDDDDDDYDIMERLREHFNKVEKKPSLDSLLDKISNSGINSLSDFERKVLNSYSKD
jgi:hypothetical protein